MSPEIISQASYSTILTVAFDLRHRLEYLSFSDRELSLFTYGFANTLYSEKRRCEHCGGHGAGHLPTRSEEINLSAYVHEDSMVGRVEGECVRCGGYYLHYSCDDTTIPKLDESMRVYGLQMKYYALKVVHQELIHDMMDLILLEAMEGESSRSDGYTAIASFMMGAAKRVSAMWCEPRARELRKRRFERLRREALFGHDHQPVLPAQAYESYLEPYEIVVKTFVENQTQISNALDLIKCALVDNPSEGNFLMMLGVAMMYINKFQDYIKAYSPRSYMTPNDPLYKQIKEQFISTDLGIIRRIPVVLMMYDMPRFFYFAELKQIVEGRKVALSSETIELCDCLIRQGRILQNDLQKRTRKGKDELMRQQLRIRDIWLGQTELEDLPRQFVHYFSQREETAKLPLALKALHLEERVVKLELAQSRGAPPTISIDLGKLPPEVLIPPKSASSRLVTGTRQPLDEARKQRIESYLTRIRQKKGPDKRDPFEDDYYSVPVDPKIVEQYTGKAIEEFRGISKIEPKSSGTKKKQGAESYVGEKQKDKEGKTSAGVESRGEGEKHSSAAQVSTDVPTKRVMEAGAEVLEQDGRHSAGSKVVGGVNTNPVSVTAKKVAGRSLRGDADSTATTETGEKKDLGQQLDKVDLPKEKVVAATKDPLEQSKRSGVVQKESVSSVKARLRREEKDIVRLGSPVDVPAVVQEAAVSGVSLDKERKREVVGGAPDTVGEKEEVGGQRVAEVSSSVKQRAKDLARTGDESLSPVVGAELPPERPLSPGAARRKQGRSCARCGEAPEKLQRCKACKVVYYCNAECQRLHWKVHKTECKKQ